MNESSRQERIIRTSVIGILVNLLIAAVGTLASSIAIVSEGINNATDAGSSFLTYIGTKLSGKHPDEKHPFGYGRIEYLTGMVVGVLILYAGLGMLKESVEGILHPSDMNVSILTVLIVAGTAVTKFILGMYTIKVGKSVESEVLLAVGEDGRNDSYFSGLTILSSVIFLFTGFSLDAYAGIVFSFVVIKSGVDTLKNTASDLSDLIGRSGKEELARKLYKEIRATDGVISAIDMMLHDYGPDRYSGSVNIEIDHKRSIGEVYEEIHRLQLRIMEEYHVTMVFGIYAVDEDTAAIVDIRRYIGKFVRVNEHVKSFHALYLSKETGTLYCDLIVDYALRDWEELRKSFVEYMKKQYSEYEISLTIETEFV
ncbi:MAG: hypothetical protein BHW17_08215 [Dorea sp. 42_8]|nr:MAG: hypothetical protein BHW17_08215 [Dorea sp. 42_8]